MIHFRAECGTKKKNEDTSATTEEKKRWKNNKQKKNRIPKTKEGKENVKNKEEAVESEAPLPTDDVDVIILEEEFMEVIHNNLRDNMYPPKIPPNP